MPQRIKAVFFFFWGFRVCIYLGLLKSVFYFPFARWGKSLDPHCATHLHSSYTCTSCVNTAAPY